MECHACGRQVERGDRFCNGCGTSLEGVTDTTEVLAVTDDQTERDGPQAAPDSESDPDLEPGEPTELLETLDGNIWAEEPVWAEGADAAAEGADTALATSDLPATEPITEVWMEQVEPAAEPDTTPYDFTEREPVAVTGEIATQPAPSASATATMPAVVAAPAPTQPRFRFDLILFIALVTGVISLIALFANVLSVTSDVRLVPTADTPAGFRTGTWILDDLADNMSIAGLLAILAMVIGGVAAGFGWRWGSGLAGGAGLAMGGIAAIAIGLAQMPVDVARAFARIPSEDPFVLTITKDVGYWLLIVAGALGIVLFFASVNDVIGDRRPGLNPWIAALGALAVVIAASGPLIPENQAVFSDNWYLIEGVGEAPAILLVGRLVQLGLFLIGGVLGFLSVRRWGLGVAVGVAIPAIWLTVSTLFELGDRPVGLGFRNPGATGMDVHGVTIIGVSAVLAMLILAIVGAYDQSVRERR